MDSALHLLSEPMTAVVLVGIALVLIYLRGIVQVTRWVSQPAGLITVLVIVLAGALASYAIQEKFLSGVAFPPQHYPQEVKFIISFTQSLFIATPLFLGLVGLIIDSIRALLSSPFLNRLLGFVGPLLLIASVVLPLYLDQSTITASVGIDKTTIRSLLLIVAILIYLIVLISNWTGHSKQRVFPQPTRRA